MIQEAKQWIGKQLGHQFVTPYWNYYKPTFIKAKYGLYFAIIVSVLAVLSVLWSHMSLSKQVKELSSPRETQYVEVVNEYGNILGVAELAEK